MKIKKFSEFKLLKENRVPSTQSDLEIQHQGESKFIVKGQGIFKEFSVVPVPKNFKQLSSIAESMSFSLKEKDYATLYQNLRKAFDIDFEFSRIFPNTVTLESLAEVIKDLNFYQSETLKNSPVTFLREELSLLSRESREIIVKYVVSNSQLMICLAEAIKFFVTKISKEEYFDQLSTKDIMKKYEEEIEKAKNAGFSIDGPFGKGEANQNDHVSWKISKKDSSYTLIAAVTPSSIRADNEISKTKGLNFSLTDESGKALQPPFQISSLLSVLQK